MNILKLITLLCLAVLPIAVLIRDWKYHDKRTKKHHTWTRRIIIAWCIASILAVYFVWSDSKQIEELIAGQDVLLSQNTILSKQNVELISGKDILIKQNSDLSFKIDQYQKDLNEKNIKIQTLEKQTKDAKLGKSIYYFFNGVIRSTHGPNQYLDESLVEKYKEIESLMEQNLLFKVIDLCKEQIIQNPDWPTPYLFLGIALNNLQQPNEALDFLKHFLKIAPDHKSYKDYRRQAEEFIKTIKR